MIKIDYHYLAADQIRARSMHWLTLRHLAIVIVLAVICAQGVLAVMAVRHG
jgi:hypothetical protein